MKAEHGGRYAVGMRFWRRPKSEPVVAVEEPQPIFEDSGLRMINVRLDRMIESARVAEVAIIAALAKEQDDDGG